MHTSLKLTVRAICFLIFVSTSPFSFSQEIEQQQQLSFSGKLNKPIEIQVEDDNGRITFVALNSSYYPYTVILEFNTFTNLSPQDRFLKAVAFKGRTNLRSYTVKDPTVGHDYMYTVTYFIGDVYAKIDKDYLYTVPLTANQKIGVTNTMYLGKMADTICAIRKGVITAVANDNENYDRIEKNSIEVLHKDGTIAIYKNVALLNNLARGQVVVPGQAIGILRAPFLKMTLLHIVDNGILREEAIKYTLDGKQVLSVSQLHDQVVQHPPLVVEREMSKSEKKAYRKTLTPQ
jgi:hypothetical protein